MRSFLLLTTLLCAMFLSVSAQKATKIKFASVRHHFGQIKEDGGVVEFTFKFKNIGNTIVKISDVEAACGCTTPSWSKESINPGDSGVVKVAFNPHNRPGYFNKTISVSANTEPKITVLTIEGNVKPKSKSIEEEYPVEMGKLRVLSKTMHLGKVLTTPEPTEKSFEIYNNSSDTLRLTTFEIPSFIKVKYPSKLAPHKAEKLIVSFDAKAFGDYGYSYYKLVLLTNESDKLKKEFFVSANVEEYFPPMTEQELAKAPKLVIETSLHDFGNIKMQQQVDAGFVLKNDGLSNLNIRAIKPNCDCLEVWLEKNTLKPGESAFIRAVFKSEGKVSYQQKTITIFSNDPKSPTQVIVLKANIVE